MYANAFQLKISRDASVGFITCHREANCTPVRGSEKEPEGFGLVLGDGGRGKGSRTCVCIGCQEEGQVYEHLSKSDLERGKKAKVIISKEAAVTQISKTGVGGGVFCHFCDLDNTRSFVRVQT